MSKQKAALKELGIPELAKKIDEMRGELFSLRLKSATEHVKDYSQFKRLRRNIARSITYLRQKLELGNQ